MRMAQVENEKLEKQREHELKMAELKAKEKSETRQEAQPNLTLKAMKIPSFKDGSDDIGAYVERFEKFATIQKWPEDSWALMLSTLLTGKALEVYLRLSNNEAQNYNMVKNELFKRYNLTEEGFRGKFRESVPTEEESVRQFVHRLERFLTRWMETAEATDLPKLKELVLREQFYNQCPNDLAVFLKERPFTNIDDMCKDADRFLEARNMKLHHDRTGHKNTKEQSNKPSGSTDNQTTLQKGSRECFNCHKVGHTRVECKNKGGGNEQQCSNCKMYGHEEDVCRNNAVISMIGLSIKGTVACEFGGSATKSLESVPAKIGNHKVKALRDSGCNIVCVNRKFVSEDQLTGKTQVCKLADGTTRRLATAVVDIDSPYLKKSNMVVVCMMNPVFDLIIGDVEDASCKCSPDHTWKLDEDSRDEEARDAITRIDRLLHELLGQLRCNRQNSPRTHQEGRSAQDEWGGPCFHN